MFPQSTCCRNAWAFLLLLHCCTARPTGVCPSEASHYEQSVLRCDGDRELPSSKVNDDYCDCADGRDEPGTSACSEGRFHCANRHHVATTLPSSLVGDGVCDCCDGSDEAHGVCVDSCAAIAQGLRDALVREAEIHEAGAVEARRMVTEAREARANEARELEELRGKVTPIQARVEALAEQVKEAEVREEAERQKRKREQVGEQMRSQVKGLGVSEATGRQLFEAWDIDSSGELSLEEFLGGATSTVAIARIAMLLTTVATSRDSSDTNSNNNTDRNISNIGDNNINNGNTNSNDSNTNSKNTQMVRIHAEQ